VRRRLLALLLSVIGLVVLALAVPFADATARSRTEQLLADRRNDATRFAALASRTLGDPDRSELGTEVRRYAELYGAVVRVVDVSGRPVVSVGPRAAVDEDAAGDGTRRALTGRTTDRLPTIRPWGPQRVVLAEPVGQDELLAGAILLAIPTDAARRDVALRWAVLAAAALAAFVLAALVAVRTTRWVLQPVSALDRAVAELATGRLDARSAVEVGPPELRRLQEHFNAMADAVGEAIRRQRDFVANASHELRNPLATLTLQLDNLEPSVDAEGRTAHAAAVEEAARLAELLDSLLALARVESGSVPLAEVDVSGAAHDRVSAWRPVAESAGIDLHLHGVAGVAARALPGAAERILDVALDNACKFVGPGGTVDVEVYDDGDAVVIRVADDGPGVPEDVLPTLTERFARAAEHQNVRGSGLGLAIADEFARASDGRLEVGRRHPRGLIVVARLPRLGSDQP